MNQQKQLQQLIDVTLKFRQQHNRGNPASIETICDHLDDVYKAVHYENYGYNKSYSGIHAQIISTTINLLLELEVYSGYLLENELLDSKFSVVLRDIIGRAFKETRHESIASDEQRILFIPTCGIILRITNSMSPELADSKIIPFFFDKTFVLSMADGLKAFASNRVLYGAEQKAMIIKAILNMFSEYCLTKGDAATSTTHLISLVNASLSCVASTIYCRIFNYELELTNRCGQSSPKTELFLDVCPKYIVRYKRARHEAMFVETKFCVVQSASKILPRFISQIDRMPEELLERVLLLMELLLLIPSDNFTAEFDLIKDLIRTVAVSETDWMKNSIIKRIVHRSISLVYTLTIDMDLCKVIKDMLTKHELMTFFANLSSNSSDEHIRFTSALINWTMSREYLPAMIKPFVCYLNECIDDPLQQYYGIAIHALITTLTDLVDNSDAREELVKQDVVLAVIKCIMKAELDIKTVQVPALETLLTMIVMPEVLTLLSESEELLTHLKMLSSVDRTEASNEEEEESTAKRMRIADALLCKSAEESGLSPSKTSKELFEYDIMISCHRDELAFSEQLRYLLIHQNKLRVWFDERNFDDLITSPMVEVIETSEVILIIMSEKYQSSPYCRSEAIYASKIRPHIIPIKVYKGFEPSGWLAILTSDLDYIDFTRDSFDTGYQDLVKNIELHGRSTMSEFHHSSSGDIHSPSASILPIEEFEKEKSSPCCASWCVESTITNVSCQKPLEDWNRDELQDFLRVHGFAKFATILPIGCDGGDLIELHSLHMNNSGELLKIMREANPDIKLSDYLLFVKVLKNHLKQAKTNNEV